MTVCVISIEGLVEAYLYRGQHHQKLEEAIIWLPQAADNDPEHVYLQKRIFSTLRQRNYSIESASVKAAEIIGLVATVSTKGRYTRRALKEPLNITELKAVKCPLEQSLATTLSQAARIIPSYNPSIRHVFY